ncbi:MAG TPA: hypothetical protein VJB95_01850 [Candidatus Paceibacterota bacterium]
MPKIVQDMIKTRPTPEEFFERARQRKEERLGPKIPPNIKRPKDPAATKRRGRRWGLWFIAVAAIIFFLFALSFLFSKAVITITPKSVEVVLNENLSANKDTSSGPLSFDLAVISGEEVKEIDAALEKEVSTKATGRVIIYNAFSAASQILSIDTRLEGSNGKIYKTDKRIIVPGMAKNGTPGKIEVGIYGSVGGTEYNSAPLDFKILGFKGTAKYEKIYARSKGEITGGFKGFVAEVSEEEKSGTISALKTALKAKLLKKITDQTPGGFILFKDAVFLESDEGSVGASSGGKAPITVKGTLYALLFDEAKLAKKIATIKIADYDGSDVFLPHMQDLKFILANKENISFAEAKSIDFNLSGKDKIVYKFDRDKFIAEIAGKQKKDFNMTLSKYKNVQSASSVIRPFWRASFPSKIENIEVVVNYPQ